MSLPFNTSMYNTQTPMQGVSSALQLMQGLRQQQLFQAQMAGKQAAGQALMGSYDPATGDFDTTKFNAAIANDPTGMAASFGGEALTSGRQAALLHAQQLSAQQEATSKALANQQTKMEMLSANLGSLIEDPRLDDPQQAGQAVIGSAAQLSAMNPDLFPLNDTLNFVKSLSHIAPDGTVPNPAALKQAILNYSSQTKAGQQAALAQAPQWDSVNQGNGTVLRDKNPFSPMAGQVKVGSFVPLQTSPSEKLAPVSTMVQNGPGAGGAGTEPAAQYAQEHGLDPNTGLPTGVTAGVGGPSQTSLSPGQQANVDRAKSISVELRQIADQAQSTQAYMGEANSLLSRIRTGGGAELRTEAARVAQGFGASPEMVSAIQGGQYDDALGSAQAFSKLMVPLAVAGGRQALGGTTGLKNQEEFTTFLQNWPHLETDPNGIGTMFDFMSTMNKVQQAKSKAWTSWINKPENSPLKTDPNIFGNQFNDAWDKARQGNAGAAPKGTQP